MNPSPSVAIVAANSAASASTVSHGVTATSTTATVECPICNQGVPDLTEHLKKAFHKPHTPTPLGYIDRHGRFVPLATK
jgi:hypothetical protein